MSTLSFGVSLVLGQAEFSIPVRRISLITPAKSSFFFFFQLRIFWNNSKKFVVLTSSTKNFLSKTAAFTVLKINAKKVY